MNKVSIQYFDAPCGRLVLGSYDGRLCLCDWLAARHREHTDARIRQLLRAEFAVQPLAVTSRAASQLDEYFNGKCIVSHLSLLMLGTVFQKLVWQSLCTRCQFHVGDSAVSQSGGQQRRAHGLWGGMEIKQFLLYLERSSATPLGL